MPSFTWSNRFREGQWRAFRKFMLEERRDASSRFLVIDAEKNRIGNLRILYAKDSTGKPTERRIGISVHPQESSLAKLLAAYTALGGNPFDISMFMTPDRAVTFDDKVYATDVAGGVLAPNDIRYSYDVGVTDGDTNLLKYQSSRSGGKRRTGDKDQEILGITTRARKWLSKEIWFKRTRLEEQIIKLMDLREQLDEEVEDLLWATYGDMIGGPGYDPARFNDSLTAGGIAYFFDSTFRVPDPTDRGLVKVDDSAEEGTSGSVNLNVLAGYTSLLTDKDEEDNSAL